MVLRLTLYSTQSPWLSSDYPYTYHGLLGGTQTIPILITVSQVALRLSLYSPQSTPWLRQFLYSSQSPWWYSDYLFTHYSLPGGPQTIPLLITLYLVAPTISILITVSVVVFRLSLYSSQTPWWYSDYPFTHHSLWWPSDYPNTHHSLPGGSDNLYTHHSLPGSTQTIPILFSVSLVVLRLSLYSSQSA